MDISIGQLKKYTKKRLGEHISNTPKIASKPVKHQSSVHTEKTYDLAHTIAV
jgi:hypothetical protein